MNFFLDIAVIFIILCETLTFNKEVLMKQCWCRFVLAVLVIVLAWWCPPWSKWALTVVGAILAILALTGKCCCATKCEEEKKEGS